MLPLRPQPWILLALIAIAAGVGCADVEDGATEGGEDALSVAKLTPADVSILLPLPKSDANETLAATAVGRDEEELLPGTAYQITGASAQHVLHESFYWNHGGTKWTTAEEERPLLRLTAVRADSCGRTTPNGPATSCVPELRLVFQPVLPNDKGTFEAADGAVHAFYRLSPDELASFVKTMFDARNAAGGFTYESLGVHPTLAKEGLSGGFAKVLFAQVTKLCGGRNLERVTFLQRTSAREPVWVFGVASVANKIAKVEQIASTTSTIQSIEGPGFNSPMHLTNVNAPGEAPTETGTNDKISAILDTRTRSEAEQIAALDASLRIDNPNIHSPETMSCVECHVASGARRSLLATKPGFEAKMDSGNAFKAPMTVAHVTSKDVGNLHAFSWKGTDPGVSDRTANDSANVAAKLSALLF